MTTNEGLLTLAKTLHPEINWDEVVTYKYDPPSVISHYMVVQSGDPGEKGKYMLGKMSMSQTFDEETEELLAGLECFGVEEVYNDYADGSPPRDTKAEAERDYELLVDEWSNP